MASGPTPLPAFVVERKSILVPKEDFDLVSIFVAEYKKRTLKRIQLECALYDGGQPIDRFSHVDMSAGEVDWRLLWKPPNRHIAFSTRSTS